MTTSHKIVFVNGRDIHGRMCSIACHNGIITSLDNSQSSPRQPTDTVIDLEGRLVLPALVEPHAHLDKAYLAERVNNPAGDLMGAILGMEAARETLTHDDIVARATRAAHALSSRGTAVVRTHVDVTMAGGLTPLQALCEVRDRCQSFIDIQVAALVEWPLTGREGATRRALARDAIAAGAQVIGGCPHLDENPRGATEFLLALALEHDVPLDLHADENLRTDSRDLETVSAMVVSSNVSHPIAASHCVSLSAMDDGEQRRIADLAASANVAVIALPLTNLYLQSRSTTSLMPRAITPVGLLREAGCVVAAGGDNLQDPFNPMGNADPLETARLMVLAAHERIDDAFESISTGAARALGLDLQLAVGSRACFVAVRATSLRETIAVGPPDRFVVHGGTVIDHQQ